MAPNDISVIASRVESLEGRLDDNIDKINTRLDAIVDLMQKVTALQEREISNALQINDLKLSIKDTNQTIKEWNSHIHERMDRHYTDIKVCREGIDSTIDNITDELESSIKDIRKQSEDTNNELQKWLNRGIGAWTIASFLIILLQGTGAYIINGVINSNRQQEVEMAALEKRVFTNEMTLQKIQEFAIKKHPESNLYNQDQQGQ